MYVRAYVCTYVSQQRTGHHQCKCTLYPLKYCVHVLTCMICMYVCTYACTYVSIYAYIHIHTKYTQTSLKLIVYTTSLLCIWSLGSLLQKKGSDCSYQLAAYKWLELIKIQTQPQTPVVTMKNRQDTNYSRTSQ